MSALSRLVIQTFLLPTFRSSKIYWDRRYRLGGTSGDGSAGDLATFKAEVINDLVRVENIERIIEFGCGDGSQLSLAEYPSYLGLDVSKQAIALCGERFRDDATKCFVWYDPELGEGLGAFLAADLTLSLDVIYHLVETKIYLSYLDNLFAGSQRFVLVYSSDRDDPQTVPHVRHRKFTADVIERHPEFRFVRSIENRYPDKSDCSFILFERRL